MEYMRSRRVDEFGRQIVERFFNTAGAMHVVLREADRLSFRIILSVCLFIIDSWSS